MKKVIIKIEDVELAKALAAALARAISEADVSAECGLADCGAEQAEGVVVLDSRQIDAEFSFLPVSALAARVREELNTGGNAAGRPAARTAAAGRDAGDCIFIGMTAGCGGCGLTASAVSLGRILSRLYGRRTLYMSLERIAAAGPQPAAPKGGAPARRLLMRAASGRLDSALIDSFVSSDEYGLCFFESSEGLNPFCLEDSKELTGLLTAIASEGGFERVILDIPASRQGLFELMSVCEKRVVVVSPDEMRRAGSELLGSLIGGSILLTHEWDPMSFGPEGADIHGQFGAEVRALAERLETE